jgi:hypothetical protein
VGGRLYTGAAIYYIRSLRKISRVLPTWVRLRKHRKEGQKILEILGCQGETPEDVSRALREGFSLEVEFYLSPHAEMGMDVDKPEDLEFARRMKEGHPPGPGPEGGFSKAVGYGDGSPGDHRG